MSLDTIWKKLNNVMAYVCWYRRLHSGKKTAYLVASPTHENIGDAAIVMGTKTILLQSGYEHIVEITTTEYWNYRKCIKRLLPSKAKIFLAGGGSMGDVYQLEEMNRRTVLDDFPDHEIIIFPQTIFYKDEKAKIESVPHYNRDSITVAAREQTSYRIMKELYPKAKIILAPDAVLSMNYSHEDRKRNGVVLCFRGDSEKLLTNEEKDIIVGEMERFGYPYSITEMMYGAAISRESRKQIVEAKINQFANAQLVITDRLHAMILCAISGTPCLVFGNNHHKVRGVYEWVKHLDYISFVHSADEVAQKLQEFVCKGSNIYTPRKEDFLELEKAVSPE